MKIKNLFMAIATVALLCTTSNLFAQGFKYEDRMNDFKEKLQLDEQTWAKFEAICNERQAKVKEVRKEAAKDSASRIEMKETREEADAKIKALLSEEKYAQYLTIKKEHRAKMKEEHKNKQNKANSNTQPKTETAPKQ